MSSKKKEMSSIENVKRVFSEENGLEQHELGRHISNSIDELSQNDQSLKDVYHNKDSNNSVTFQNPTTKKSSILKKKLKPTRKYVKNAKDKQVSWFLTANTGNWSPDLLFIKEQFINGSELDEESKKSNESFRLNPIPTRNKNLNSLEMIVDQMNCGEKLNRPKKRWKSFNSTQNLNKLVEEDQENKKNEEKSYRRVELISKRNSAFNGVSRNNQIAPISSLLNLFPTAKKDGVFRKKMVHKTMFDKLPQKGVPQTPLARNSVLRQRNETSLRKHTKLDFGKITELRESYKFDKNFANELLNIPSDIPKRIAYFSWDLKKEDFDFSSFCRVKQEMNLTIEEETFMKAMENFKKSEYFNLKWCNLWYFMPILVFILLLWFLPLLFIIVRRLGSNIDFLSSKAAIITIISVLTVFMVVLTFLCYWMGKDQAKTFYIERQKDLTSIIQKSPHFRELEKHGLNFKVGRCGAYIIMSKTSICGLLKHSSFIQIEDDENYYMNQPQFSLRALPQKKRSFSQYVMAQ